MKPRGGAGRKNAIVGVSEGYSGGEGVPPEYSHIPWMRQRASERENLYLFLQSGCRDEGDCCTVGLAELRHGREGRRRERGEGEGIERERKEEKKEKEVEKEEEKEA